MTQPTGRRSARFGILFVIVLLIALFALVIARSGRILVVDGTQPADVIVVLSGDHNDLRYWHGLDLLREGYARHMIVDADMGVSYGHTAAERAAQFAAETAGNLLSEVSVCSISEDSTLAESGDVGACMAKLIPAPRSGIIVTHDYHTRRALSIFRHRLPRYRWVTSAAHDENVFGQPWWSHREWAKTNLTEWQKTLWWELWEQWKN